MVRVVESMECNDLIGAALGFARPAFIIERWIGQDGFASYYPACRSAKAARGNGAFKQAEAAAMQMGSLWDKRHPWPKASTPSGNTKQQRRIATRFDAAVLSFKSFLDLAAIRLWPKFFVNRA